MNRLAVSPSIDTRPDILRDWFPRLRHTAIGRALMASAVIHVLLFAFVPGFRNALPRIPLPERLDVLLKPKAEIPPPVAAPEPKLQPRPQPNAQPQIQRRVESREPTPRAPEQRVITAAPETPAANATNVETQRSIEPSPVPEIFKPVAPEPPRPAPAVELPSDGMIAAYGSGFKASVDRNRRYPRVAQDRGWQGTATVLVKVLPGGRMGDVSIAKSSGFDLLDDTARDMVKTAQLPAMPELLRNHGFEMRVPVEFKLL